MSPVADIVFGLLLVVVGIAVAGYLYYSSPSGYYWRNNRQRARESYSAQDGDLKTFWRGRLLLVAFVGIATGLAMTIRGVSRL